MSRLLRVSRTLFFTMTWQPCCASSLLAAAVRFTLFRCRSFWAGLYCFMWLLLTKHLSTSCYVVCFSKSCLCFQVLQTYPSLNTSEPSFSDGNMHALGFRPLALIDRSRNRPPSPYTLALLGRLQRGLVGVFLSFAPLLSIGILYPMLEGRPPGQWRRWAMQHPAKKK